MSRHVTLPASIENCWTQTWRNVSTAATPRREAGAVSRYISGEQVMAIASDGFGQRLSFAFALGLLVMRRLCHSGGTTPP